MAAGYESDLLSLRGELDEVRASLVRAEAETAEARFQAQAEGDSAEAVAHEAEAELAKLEAKVWRSPTYFGVSSNSDMIVSAACRVAGCPCS